MPTFADLPPEMVAEVASHLFNPDLFNLASTRLCVSRNCQKLLKQHKDLSRLAKFAVTDKQHRGRWLSFLLLLLKNPGIEKYIYKLQSPPESELQITQAEQVEADRLDTADAKIVRDACQMATWDDGKDHYMLDVQRLIDNAESLSTDPVPPSTSLETDWHLLTVILPRLDRLHTLSLDQGTPGELPNSKYLEIFLSRFAEVSTTSKVPPLPTLTTLNFSGIWFSDLVLGFLCLPSVRHVWIESLCDELHWPANFRKSRASGITIPDSRLNGVGVMTTNKELLANVVGPCTIRHTWFCPALRRRSMAPWRLTEAELQEPAQLVTCVTKVPDTTNITVTLDEDLFSASTKCEVEDVLG